MDLFLEIELLYSLTNFSETFIGKEELFDNKSLEF
jgi:hypothetical protein